MAPPVFFRIRLPGSDRQPPSLSIEWLLFQELFSAWMARSSSVTMAPGCVNGAA